MIRLLEILKEKNKYTIYLNSKLREYGIDLAYLEKFYRNLKHNKLYKSPFHGLYHSEKVVLYILILSKFYGLNEVLTQILVDGGFYHDRKRENDYEDSTHGLASARCIEEVVCEPNSIYEDKNNLGYLKAIVEAHSLKTRYKSIIFNNYLDDYPDLDEEVYNILYDIFLDCDALDRARFRVITEAALKEEYLRTQEAKNLIEFAKMLNKYYSDIQARNDYERLRDQFNPNDPNKQLQGCFHAIGNNFFALESILQNGILSGFAMEQANIDSFRNYSGNNNDLFISVIEDQEYSANGEANKKFLKDNISLYCLVTNLCKGKKQHQKFIDSLPTNSGEYSDEMFAFYKISKDQIYSIVLNKHLINKDIKVLEYMEGSRNYDIVNEKVKFYLKKLKEFTDNNQYYNKLDVLLTVYRKTVVEFEKLNQYDQQKGLNDFCKKLDNMLIQINLIIQEIINLIWHIKLNKNMTETISIKDVICHILKENNINYNLQDSGDELLFVLNQQKVKKR